jgi:surface antigen
MKLKTWIILSLVLFILAFAGLWTFKNYNTIAQFETGQKIDAFNGVNVYYNGRVGNVSGRNTTTDGYNLGLKYQCVEFVKRYYYQHLNHKMPNSYGHAKDFFNPSPTDGQKNTERNLIQYTNHSKTKPKANDLLIFEGNFFNRYGHVAIISQVGNKEVEIIQQNAGPFGPTRENFRLSYENGKWRIENDRVLGWLRKS